MAFCKADFKQTSSTFVIFSLPLSQSSLCGVLGFALIAMLITGVEKLVALQGEDCTHANTVGM